MKFMNVARRYGAVLLSGVVVSGSAMATPAYDVAAATTAITGGNTAIATLGGAALVLIVGLKVWKRLRGAA